MRLATFAIAVAATALASCAVNPAVAPYLNAYPLPNGANLGDGTALHSFQFDQRLNQHFFQGRIQLQI